MKNIFLWQFKYVPVTSRKMFLRQQSFNQNQLFSQQHYEHWADKQKYFNVNLIGLKTNFYLINNEFFYIVFTMISFCYFIFLVERTCESIEWKSMFTFQEEAMILVR